MGSDNGKDAASGSALSKYAACCVPHIMIQFCMAAGSVVLPAMLQDPSLSLPGASFAAVWNASGSAANAVSKAITGPLIDSIGAVYLLGAMPLLTLATLALAAAPSKGVLLAAWVAMTMCMSGSWAAESKCVARLFAPEQYAGCFAMLAAGGRLASMGAKIALGVLLATTTWRSILYVGAAVVAGGFALALALLPRGQAPPPAAAAAAAAPGTRSGPRPSKLAILADPALLLQAGALMGATCMCNGLENMVALLLVEVGGLDASAASVGSASFPAALFIAVTFVSPVYQRLGARGRVVLELALQGIGVVGGGALVLAARSGGGGAGASPWLGGALAAACVGCGFGFAMTYYITPSIFALGYGEDSATVMSVLNGAGMAGSVGFQSLAGAAFASGGGWAEVLRLLVGCALGGVACTVALARREYASKDKAS